MTVFVATHSLFIILYDMISMHSKVTVGECVHKSHRHVNNL